MLLKKNETKWAGITAHTDVYLFAFNGKVTSVPVTSGCQGTTWVVTKPKFLTFEMEYFRKNRLPIRCKEAQQSGTKLTF